MADTLHRQDYRRDAQSPLAGLRVLDISRLVAGNMVTHVLADFGAEVLKIEDPVRGDDLRNWRVEGVSTYWKVYARNKKSLTLDYRTEDGRKLFAELVKTADVLVENFVPGRLEKYDLGPDWLHSINDKLIVVRVSGWGQTGPFRHKPGFGSLVEAMSGFAAMNGFGDRPSVLPPLALADMVAGLYGAAATTIALRHVEVGGGKGQVIDLSLFEPMLAILGPQAANHALSGAVPPRIGSRSTTASPRSVYECSDGKFVAMSASMQSMAVRLFATMGRPDLIADPRYRTNTDRIRNDVELDAVVADFMKARHPVRHRHRDRHGLGTDAVRLLRRTRPHHVERARRQGRFHGRDDRSVHHPRQHPGGHPGAAALRAAALPGRQGDGHPRGLLCDGRRPGDEHRPICSSLRGRVLLGLHHRARIAGRGHRARLEISRRPHDRPRRGYGVPCAFDLPAFKRRALARRDIVAASTIEAVIPTRPDWLAQVREAPLSPEVAVVDSHHHLWDRGGLSYFLDEFLSDAATGPTVEATIYLEAHSHYLTDGPEHLKPVGEVAFAASVAEESARGGGPRVCAGIVGHADMRIGDGLDEIVEAMAEAGKGRFRGLRHVAAWHPDPSVKGTITNPPPDLLRDERTRRAVKVLESGGHTFETWALHTQLGDLLDLARSAPDLTIVMDHAGGAIGMGPYAGHREMAFAEWRSAIRGLARAPNVRAKIGGFGMRLWGFDFGERDRPPSSEELAAAIRPYVEELMEAFGPERCMFESNFPVDKGSFSYVVLWNAFRLISSQYERHEVSSLMAGAAMSTYKVQS